MGVRRWWSWSNSPLGGLALVALGLLALLPGVFWLPPVDRDESRFAQASWQMAAGEFPGDWIVPRIQDRPRLNKPPLIYWLQATSVRAGAGDAALDRSSDVRRAHIGWYRVPSVLSAIAAGLLTWWIGRRAFAPGVGWLAGAMLVCCVMVLWDGRQARADQLLLACTTLAMAGLWSGWRAALRVDGWAGGRLALRHGWWWALWGGVALGVLAKGPITPMVVVLTAVALSLARGRWRWLGGLGALSGVGLVALVVGPWVVAVADRVGFGAYASLVLDETLGRAGEAKEGHWGPPGYHLVLLAVMFWPGSLLTAAAVGHAVRRRAGRERAPTPMPTPAARVGWFGRARAAGRGALLAARRARPAALFMLCWIAPSWLVFEAFSTKLPHYTLPLYPAIALLTARGVLSAAAGGMAGLGALGARAGVVVWQGIGIALALLPIGATVALAIGASRAFDAGSALPGGAGWSMPHAGLVGAASALLACGVIGCGMVVGARGRRGWAIASVASLVIAAGIAAVVFRWALPGAPALWASSAIAERVAALDPSASRPVLLVGYKEDSLVFLTRGRARRVGRAELGVALRREPSAIVAIDLTDDEFGALDESRRGEVVRAFNYSNGDWVRVWVGDDAEWIAATLAAP